MLTPGKEILEIVDRQGAVIGLADRAVLHSDPALIHRVVHVLVFNQAGALLLQKRSMKKDIAPGKWDTSVGGHINPGEEASAAAVREMYEELGISAGGMELLYTYLFTNLRESELVTTFRCSRDGHWDGHIDFNRDEIDEVRYWDVSDIQAGIGKNIFSSHFEQEFRKYLEIGPDRINQ
jgi:isopentenyldiphosphate isomerase